MALRAWGLIQDSEVSAGDNTKLKLYVRVCVFGSDIGDLNEAQNTVAFDGITTGVGLPQAIRDAMATWLGDHSVPYNPGIPDLDTVAIY